MSKELLMAEIETIICSPMKRTIQTMCEGLEGVLNANNGKRVKVEFDAGWQGKLFSKYVENDPFLLFPFNFFSTFPSLYTYTL